MARNIKPPIKTAAKKTANQTEPTLLTLLSQLEGAVATEKEEITGGVSTTKLYDRNILLAAQDYHHTREVVAAIKLLAQHGLDKMLPIDLVAILNYSNNVASSNPMFDNIKNFAHTYEEDLMKAVIDITRRMALSPKEAESNIAHLKKTIQNFELRSGSLGI